MWQQQHERGELCPPQCISPMDNSVPTKKKIAPVQSDLDQADQTDGVLRENQRLRAEVAYLKKVRALVLAKEISAAERAQIVIELKHAFPLADLLHAARLPRSTFYYQSKALAMSGRHDALKVKIQAVFLQHRGLYGYRRVTAAIHRNGQVVNHKTVQRLMSEMGIKSRVRRKKFRSYRGELGRAVPNVLNREFTASQANRKWVTDVTEFGVAGKKLYLSPIMDLYSGDIVAYQTSHRPDFSLVMDMLKKAVENCKATDGLLLHSDQGWHYRMQPYRAALAQYRMKQSMSRKGNCFDNAAMESFFATLKAEYFHLSDFDEDVEQLNAGLRRYIDYYNRHRIKSKLGDMSPVEYRLQAEHC